MFTKKSLAILVTMLLGVIMIGCSDNEVTAPTNTQGTESLSFTMDLAPALAADFNVTTVTVTITQGLFSAEQDLVIDGTTASGTFENIDVGTYQVAVEVYEGTTVIAYGNGAGVVETGQTTVVDIELTFVGSLIVNVGWGENTILYSAYPVGDSSDVDLYSMKEDGSNATLLVDDSSQISYGSFSPDMTHITYSSNLSTSPNLYMVDADGSNMVTLTANSDPYGVGSVWRDDDTLWYFRGVATGHTPLYEMTPVVASGTQTVLYDPIDSSRQVGLFDVNDTHYVYYEQGSSNSYSGGLFISPVTDPTAGITLVDSGQNENYPIISPDGTKVLFLRCDGADAIHFPRNLYIIDIDGTNETALTFETATDKGFGIGFWSPDGTQIMLSYNDGVQSDLYRIEADGTGLINVTNTPDTLETISDWR